jgi:nucleoid-associated protein YgaU
MKLLTLLTLTLVLNACSFSDSQKEEVAVHHDDLEFAVDTIADSANTEFQVEEQKIEEPKVEEPKMADISLDDVGVVDTYQESTAQEPSMAALEEPTFEEFKRPETRVVAQVPEVQEAPARINIQREEPSVTSYGATENYRFQKGDTLMMVAFKIYGDYRKWRDLKKWNKDKREIVEGTELKYYVPNQKFGWRPDGLPYLVKTGDTLQIISKDKYNTTRKWKSLYEHNRPLIRNPNLIFAGFTIYYQPTRDLASQPK